MTDKIRIGKSKIAGIGLFAEKRFKKGDLLFKIDGPIIKYKVEPNYRIGPNWVCTRANEWRIPLRDCMWRYINHCCEPNSGVKQENCVVAMRDLKIGEELTIDYSTVEGLRTWRINCSCKSTQCRRIIRSVQFLPRSLYLKYKTYISPFLREIYEKEKTYVVRKAGKKMLLVKNPIKKGEHIFKVEGPTIKYFSAPDYWIGYRWLAVGKKRWIIPSLDNPWSSMRHSCDPNTGMAGINIVVAMRDILPDEELTIDNSITEADVRWKYRCHCGAKKCRKIVRSVQFLGPALYRHYEPFMTKFLKNQYISFNKK